MAHPKATIHPTLESVFTKPWDYYFHHQKENELSLSLKKKAKEALITQSIEEEAMEADSEVPATHQKLQDLIQWEATQIANKRIQQGIAALRKAVLAKITKRGPSTKGAFQKTKKVKNTKFNEARPQTRTSPQQLEQTLAPKMEASGPGFKYQGHQPPRKETIEKPKWNSQSKSKRNQKSKI
jgi:hypothetical protein